MFYSEGGQILKHIAQRGGGIFILADSLKPTGQKPEQPGIIGPDFEIDQMTDFQNSCPT